MGASDLRKAGSKMSPERKGTGNVFGVELNSFCPISQNSVATIIISFF